MNMKKPINFFLIIVSVILIVIYKLYKNKDIYINYYKIFIQRTEVLALILTLTIFIILFIETIKHITKLKLDKKYLTIVISIAILSFILTMLFVPRGNRLYFDEDIYLDMAKQIKLSGVPSLCDYFYNNSCFKNELMKWPAFYPLSLAIFSIPIGLSSNVASIFNILISSLSIILVYFISRMIYKDKNIAVLSSVIYSVLPLRILWSTSNASEILFSFMILVNILFIILFLKTKNINVFLLSLIVSILASETRIEGAVMFFILLISAIIERKLIYKYIKNSMNFILIITLIVLISSPFILRYIYFSNNSWGASGNKFDVSYFGKNFIDNTKFIMSYDLFDKGTAESKQLYNNYFAGFLFMFSIPFIIYYSTKNKKFLIVFATFVLMFLLYASFYAGSVTYGVDVRYMISILPLISILSVYPIKFIGDKFKCKCLLISFTIILILLSFAYQIKYITMPLSHLEEAKECRVYHRFVISHIKDFDKNCIFISHVSSIYTVNNRNSIQIWYANENPKFLKNKSCVILDYGYWCKTTDHGDICDNMLKTYNHTLLYESDEVNGKKYKFYELFPNNYTN